MTVENLQKIIDQKNISAKILYIEKCDIFIGYWIVYTYDLSYKPEEPLPRSYLIEPEKDILASDYEEAIEYICNPV